MYFTEDTFEKSFDIKAELKYYKKFVRENASNIKITWNGGVISNIVLLT